MIFVETIRPGESEAAGSVRGDPAHRARRLVRRVLPDRITVYRNPTLRICDTAEQVVRQVGVTVAHEIGHHFGISDARLHQLGYG
ncbi:metallopeptidase family protein [Streptacidiphilus sp. 4-A2]|nr:metallopeptidase family protein [Streptacidiphilus sp. 4-A2]